MLRVDEESNQDLVLVDSDEDSDDDEHVWLFGWKEKERCYKREPQHDKIKSQIIQK